ncbi:MAG: radical SAM family heme chaperone HemW [Clostridiales bacterium]|nr:radical SAM family heme chaperone HemW [Clostridiales bacterium]
MSENNKSMGLYIHIPFCNKKCDYCDFVSYSMDRKAQQLYLDGLFTEIDMLKNQYIDKTFDSIFIGGGTPSIVYEGFIASLARKLYSSFHFKDKIEFTIEVNPSSFTKEKFFEYVESGVNRISVGVQCLDSKLLANNGRIQSMENIKDTFKILKNSEFPNVNSDVMIGLPGQDAGSVLKTVKFLIKHNVKHISTYSLQLEKHTMLYDKLRRGKIKPVSEKVMLSIYNKVYKLLTRHGFHRYEVSNFAKPGFECRHNKKYWDGTDYLGLGVSAHSFIDGYRYYNTKRLDTYIDHMKEGKSAVYSREYVSIAESRTERIMLSLRTTVGLDLSQFMTDFNEDLLRSKAEQIKKLKDMKMIEIVDGFLRITKDYFYVSNSIIVELL